MTTGPHRRLAPMLCLLALAAGRGLPAQDGVPSNDGWVTDRAHLLTPQQEDELERMLGSYQAGSGHDIAVLTLADLGGRGLEELALATARAWKLGQRDLHDGALLLVAMAERRMRIEVGRGLEGVLTDATCGRIIRDTITPAFRDKRYYDGLRAGLLAIHAAAGGGYAPEGSGSQPAHLALGLVALALLVFLGLVALAQRHPNLPRWRVGPAYRGGLHPGLGGFSGGRGGSFSGGGFSGFGGGGGFSGGGASGGW